MASHHHDAVIHDHEHLHAVHYQQHGSQWEHLTSSHTHQHNHPALDHDHFAHVNPEQEHRREAHVHDHAHPTTD